MNPKRVESDYQAEDDIPTGQEGLGDFLRERVAVMQDKPQLTPAEKRELWELKCRLVGEG